MSDEEPDDPVARYAEELRARRGYMQERAPVVSVRERLFHVGVIVAIAVVLIVAKVISAFSAESCAITGNVSRSGARIDHPPTAPAYRSVVIEAARGERVFRTEREAVTAAGDDAAAGPT